MASNRSNPKSRSTAQTASGQTPRDALTAVARHGVRIQIAALTAAREFICGLLSDTAVVSASESERYPKSDV